MTSQYLYMISSMLAVDLAPHYPPRSLPPQSGAIIYANRVPERWFPGKFDLWLHSHQLFHVSPIECA